jgi:hypothetical protein
VLAARDPLLTAEVASRLAAQAPKSAAHIVDVPPVVGAALLGLDHIGAGPAAGQRLRAALTGYAGEELVSAGRTGPATPMRLCRNL